MEYGIIRGTIKKRTKATAMRFDWAHDKVEHKNFDFKWKPGHMNLGDYFTKHHRTTHHRSMRQTYLLDYFIAVKECIL